MCSAPSALSNTLARMRAHVTLGREPKYESIKCSSTPRKVVSHCANRTWSAFSLRGSESQRTKGARTQSQFVRNALVTRGRPFGILPEQKEFCEKLEMLPDFVYHLTRD